MTVISIRISDDLNKHLDQIAYEEERSKTFLIRKAIENYLEDFQDYHLAEEGYKRYLAGGKKGYTIEEVAKRLNINPKELA